MCEQRIFGFFSGGASSIRYLIENDPNYRNKYKFSCVFSDNKNASALGFFQGKFIDEIVIDWKDFKKERTNLPKNEVRENYFRILDSKIKKLNPDLILLSGFLLLIPDFFIERHEKKIVSVHPADLRIKGDDGKPKYRGDGKDVIPKMIKDGYTEFCSTIHYIEKGEYDCGEIICVSPSYHSAEGETATEIQEKMKTLCDGPAYVEAMRLLLQ